MKLEGAQKVPAPRAAVWRALMDPAVLQRILPGCEKFEAAGEHRYAAEFKAGIGAFKSSFSGDAYRVRCDGQAPLNTEKWLLDELARLRAF